MDSNKSARLDVLGLQIIPYQKSTRYPQYWMTPSFDKKHSDDAKGASRLIPCCACNALCIPQLSLGAAPILSCQ